MVDAPILIVGCGPTGLTVTHELLRRGKSCHLVDKRPASQSSTRAFAVRAHGIARTTRSPFKGIGWHTWTAQRVHLDSSPLSTPERSLGSFVCEMERS
jgi:2-polyprenyl-6-methoxyphenol hydroxylase-like FAD-dependent oxidoreductase